MRYLARDLWLFFALFSLVGGFIDGKEVRLSFRKSRLPDFQLSPRPIEIGEQQAVSALLQWGPQTFRANMTYAISLRETDLWKFSAEFLSQKLGYEYVSGRAHRWVSQGAFGATYRLPLQSTYIDFVDMSLSYSSAVSRKLPKKLIHEGSEIEERRIAGSDGISGQASGCMCPWSSARIQGKLFYDYVRYRRRYSGHLIAHGLGGGVEFQQALFRLCTFSLGIDFREPFIYCHAALSSPFFYFGDTGTFSLFGEKVQGRRSAPSSSRIGVEIQFAFGSSRKMECSACETVQKCSEVASFSATPAVYMPEVLAIKDKKISPLSEAPFVGALIGTITARPLGFSLDLSSYFGGSSPLIYGASNLPSGFHIDPQTGLITGIVDASLPAVFELTAFAINGAGRAEQTFTLIFQ